jgi:DNA-binding transcriptional ArsR family regulator
VFSFRPPFWILVESPKSEQAQLPTRGLQTAIGNCVSSLLTNHNRMVMVLGVKPAIANHVFRALADPTRRAIFEELTRQGEQTVHALTGYAGVSQPAVSKHLTVLKRAKLVRHRREGRETHYRAQPDALAPMVDWLNLYGAFWRDRFDRLEALLERME